MSHPLFSCLLAHQSDLCTVSGKYKWVQGGGGADRAERQERYCHTIIIRGKVGLQPSGGG